MSVPPAGPPVGPAPRPLPAQPNLAFERKAAKALLRQLRAGDPEALARARARHPALDDDPARVQLAEAQLVIAREYGFASWPKLVRYYGDVERRRHSHRRIESREHLDGQVRALIARHANRRSVAGRALASYVPRFYGLPVEEIFAAAVTEDEARLTVAREAGFPSWEVLLAHPDADGTQRSDWERDPFGQANRAITAGDLDALRAVVAAHPELRHPSESDTYVGRDLMTSALFHVTRGAPLEPIASWLGTQGFDLQGALNRSLCGGMRMRPEMVRRLLDLGADPNAVMPNGIPVLEHALIRYWNGAAVDVLAPHTVPRRALWIAAGLGDLAGVRRSLDQNGKPTPTARRLRPDFLATFGHGFPSHPEPGDEEILQEAFVVAMLNSRTEVMEYMASRGFDVNSMLWDSPVLNVAVGNAWVPVVESLVRCGANLDLRGWQPSQTPREIARGMFEQMPDDPDRRRILVMLGMDPDAVLAERDARPLPPPEVHPKLQEALERAGDDAYRLGQHDILPDNLFVGLLREGALGFIAYATKIDGDLLRADLRERVHPDEPREHRPKLPLHPDAQAVMESMLAYGAERRRTYLTTYSLLHALARMPDGPVARLLARYELGTETLVAELERSL